MELTSDQERYLLGAAEKAESEQSFYRLDVLPDLGDVKNEEIARQLSSFEPPLLTRTERLNASITKAGAVEVQRMRLTRWRDQADLLLAWVNEQTGGSFAVQIDAYKYCNGNNLTKDDIDGILNYFLFSRKHLNGYYVGAMVLGDEIDEAVQTEQSVSLTEEGAKHLAQIRQAAVRSSLPPAPHVRTELKMQAQIDELKRKLEEQSNSDIPFDEGRYLVAAFDISFEHDPTGTYKFDWIKLGEQLGFNQEYSRHWIDELERRGHAKIVGGNETVLTRSGKEAGRSRAISPVYWSELEIAVVERAWKIWLGDRYPFNPWAIKAKEPAIPLSTEEMRAMRRRLIRRGVWKNVEVEGAQPDVGTEFTDEVREIYKDRFGTEVLKGLGVPSMRPFKLYDRADAVEERLKAEIQELKAKPDPNQSEIERLSKELKQHRDDIEELKKQKVANEGGWRKAGKYIGDNLTKIVVGIIIGVGVLIIGGLIVLYFRSKGINLKP